MRRIKNHNRKSSPREFWQSYSDMMAVLLLVFALVLTGSILQARKELENKQDELGKLEKALVEKMSEYEEESERLNEEENRRKEVDGNLEAERQINIQLSKDLEEAENTIIVLTEELEDLKTRYKTVITNLSDTNAKLSSAQDDKTTLESDLDTANAAILVIQGALDTANATITTLEKDLDDANTTITNLEGDLEEANASILIIQGNLDNANKTISILEGKLDDAAITISDMEGTMKEKDDEINEKTAALDQIVGVRKSLIEELGKEFSGMNLLVNQQTGAITLDSDLLFKKNRSTLQKEGEIFLDDFFPRYVEVLLGGSFAPYISEIIIEGHADTDGTYLVNLQLSQNRALAVVAYCLDDDRTMFDTARRDELRKIITANGRSWSNPILNSDGTVNMDRSRRVEIQFRLKDEEMIDQMKEVLG